MSTKKIPINGKPEVAYAIIRLEKTIPTDFSDMIKNKNAIRQREVFRIIFQDWAYEFPLASEPKGTVLTLNNIDGADYEIKRSFLDNMVHSTVRLTLPDGRKIQEGPFYSNESPIKSLTLQEKELVERLEASERKPQLASCTEEMQMKTKIIPVNGKNERAYRVSRTGETVTRDVSFVVNGEETREAEIVRIIFRDWAYERPLFIPEGTRLTPDNIVSIDDPSPSVKNAQKVKIGHFTDILEWSKPSLYVGLEDYEITLKFPECESGMIQGSSTVSSPVKELTIDEKRFVKELEASERNADESAKKSEAVLSGQNSIMKGLTDIKKDIHSMAPDIRRGKKQKEHCQEISHKGGKARRKYTDKKIIEVFKKYKMRNPSHRLSTAVGNIITKKEQYPDEYLNYKNTETLLRRLMPIARQKKPCQWWEGLKVL